MPPKVAAFAGNVHVVRPSQLQSSNQYITACLADTYSEWRFSRPNRAWLLDICSSSGKLFHRKTARIGLPEWLVRQQRR